MRKITLNMVLRLGYRLTHRLLARATRRMDTRTAEEDGPSDMSMPWEGGEEEDAEGRPKPHDVQKIGSRQRLAIRSRTNDGISNARLKARTTAPEIIVRFEQSCWYSSNKPPEMELTSCGGGCGVLRTVQAAGWIWWRMNDRTPQMRAFIIVFSTINLRNRLNLVVMVKHRTHHTGDSN
jgi:hypothetical protein